MSYLRICLFAFSYEIFIETEQDLNYVCVAGTEEEPLKLSPLHKMKEHARYALKCYFSPDSRLDK